MIHNTADLFRISGLSLFHHQVYRNNTDSHCYIFYITIFTFIYSYLQLVTELTFKSSTIRYLWLTTLNVLDNGNMHEKKRNCFVHVDHRGAPNSQHSKSLSQEL